MHDFTNKRILVAGGSRSIGLAVLQAFAYHNARIAINYLSNHKMTEETLASLKGKGHVALQFDISKSDDARRLVDDAIKTLLGGLDIIVNNARGWHLSSHRKNGLLGVEWQAVWKKTLELNLRMHQQT